MRSVELGCPCLSGAKNSTPLLHWPVAEKCTRTLCCDGELMVSLKSLRFLIGLPNELATPIDCSVALRLSCVFPPPPPPPGSDPPSVPPPPPQPASSAAAVTAGKSASIRTFIIVELRVGAAQGAG